MMYRGGVGGRDCRSPFGFARHTSHKDERVLMEMGDVLSREGDVDLRNKSREKTSMGLSTVRDEKSQDDEGEHGLRDA